MKTEQITREIMLHTAAEIYAAPCIGLTIEEALTLPKLSSVAKQKAFDIVALFTRDIFDSFGKTQDATKDIFAATFVDRYNDSTIGDLRCFTDMVIAGEVEIKFLSTADLFKAWKVYCSKRAAVIEKLRQAEERAARDRREAAGDFVKPEVIGETHRHLSLLQLATSRYWDDYCAAKKADNYSGDFAHYRFERLTTEPLLSDTQRRYMQVRNNCREWLGDEKSLACNDFDRKYNITY